MAQSAFQKKLNKTKTTKTSAKKSSMPVVDLPHLTDIMEDFIASQKAEKEAKAEKEIASGVLVTAVREIQDKEAFAGKYNKSFVVQGIGDIKVKYVSKDQYSIVNPDDVDDLEALLEDEYDTLLEEKFVITVKDEIFNDEEKQQALIKLLGDDWDTYLETSSTLVARKGFDSKVYDVVENQKTLNQVRVFVRQHTPSIR